jgi:hypothetical protein
MINQGEGLMGYWDYWGYWDWKFVGDGIIGLHGQ